MESGRSRRGQLCAGQQKKGCQSVSSNSNRGEDAEDEADEEQKLIALLIG